jgi:transglutaminase-like putative cysteine protease
MTYDIFHETVFNYQSPVTFSHNIARLKPKESKEQTLTSFRLDVEPQASEIHMFSDMFGNINHHLLVREPHASLKVTGHSRVVRDVQSIGDAIETMRKKSPTYSIALERLAASATRDALAKQFLFASELVPVTNDAIRAFALASFQNERSVFEAAEELMGRIYEEFEFNPMFSDISTPVATIFEEKKGVCQDFAHLAIAALRSIGLPARYVSGYIETLPPEGTVKLFGADASHAWVSVYLPGAGWLDLDPTNNLIPCEQHIILGHGRDYDDISPLKGVVRSSGHSHLGVRVDVRRVEESAEPVSEAKKNTQIQIQMQSQNQW